MNTLQNLLSFPVIFLACFYGMAQPFELDPKIKPIELLLVDDSEVEGAKGVTTAGSIKDDRPTYYYVKGHDVFQNIDVFIFSNYGNPKFKVELVKDTWNDVAETQTSTSQKDGIINFKLRTWGDFGFRITPETPLFYTVIVYASSPVKNYLDSPFIKATKENTGISTMPDEAEVNTLKNTETNVNDESNLWLYAGIGILLLIVGVLMGKILSRKNAAIILLLIGCGGGPLYAQFGGGVTWGPGQTRPGGDYELWLRRQGEINPDNSVFGDVEQISGGLDRLGKVGSNLGKIQEAYEKMQDYEEAYKDLGNCMNSATPPGAPRLPSFCADTESSCGRCFLEAREKFNFTRYQFEKLAAIYNCTKDYSDKAIALGDNVSGIHAVSGMAWQIQKTNIVKSVKELQEAVDKKYAELVGDLQESLMMLDECEAEHGIPDWYDRFGYMYYEFMQINYKRKE